MDNNLLDRVFNFTIRTIKYLRSLPENHETRVIKYQLIKSVTSTGANYEEAQAGCSRADFSNKVSISLKEIRESNYWLRIIQSLDYSKKNNEELCSLIKESNELKSILGSIAQKTRKVAQK